jgi:hypothetical protein
MKAKKDILQGTLALLVLKTLQQRPMHGWGYHPSHPTDFE